MTARLWIFTTFSTIAAVVGASAAIAYAVDPYGILRDPKGRDLIVYFFELKAKYLVNERYVPANFDGLIIGPSSSANWDVPSLAGARIYNESIPGGNAAEEQMLVDRALDKGHFKMAVFILEPSMTANHDINEGVAATKNVEAFGSFHLFAHEAAFALHAAHIKFNKSDSSPNGKLVLNYAKRIQAAKLGAGQFNIDREGLNDYRDLIESLQAKGATIVYVAPPVYEPQYKLNEAAYKTYLDTIRMYLPPGPIINLNGPEYTAFRSNPDNYIDCWHLEPQGASTVAALLEKLVPQAISSRH
jgi:hypothetical protein